RHVRRGRTTRHRPYIRRSLGVGASSAGTSDDGADRLRVACERCTSIRTSVVLHVRPGGLGATMIEPVPTSLEPPSTVVPGTPGSGPPSPPSGHPRAVAGLDDRVFRGFVRTGGVMVLVITGAVGLFLFLRAATALRSAGFKFLTTQAWQPDAHHFGIESVLGYTVLIALVAITISTPLAIGTALFISEVVPARLRWLPIAVIDLMAAVPSVVFGLWGLFYLQGHLI